MKTHSLTREEREALSNATPQDWAEAITELVKDSEFWGEMATSFLEGFTRAAGR